MDVKTQKMIHAIILVNSDVRDAALEEFLRRSLFLHSVAFLQWRLKHPSKIKFIPEEIHEGIVARIQLIYGEHKDDGL